MSESAIDAQYPRPGGGRIKVLPRPNGARMTTDESIAARIEALVAEEHKLRGGEQTDRRDVERLDADRDRLRDVQVELDRCWDLLRQRRAREEFGQDPDSAELRDEKTVEGYEG
jgi:hypothetical protein